MNPREIPNYWEGHCFACSKTNMKGLQLRFWRTQQGCFTHCSIPDHLCGFDGIVHGGIIATLLDEVGAWAIITHLTRFGVTQEITVRYYKPVPTNREIVVEGQIISNDERKGILHSTVHDVHRTLLAESESKWLFPSLSHITKISGIDISILQEFLDQYSQADI